MSAATAPGLAETFLYQTLSADAQLAALVGTRIYASQAPQGAAYPLLVFAAQGGVDTTALGFIRVLTQLRYVVRAADKAGSIAGLDAIMARVDALLHGQSWVAVDAGAMLACQRERVLTAPGSDAGVATRELANVYLVIVQEK